MTAVSTSGPSAPRSTLAATGLVILAACCFGSISIFVVLATRAGAPLLTVLALRYLIGSVGLFAIAGGAAVLREARGRLGRFFLLGGVGQALIAFGSLSALRFIPVGALVFLFYTYPSWIAVIAAARGTERVSPLRVLALGLSLAGIGVMVGAPARESLHPLGVALALGSALLYALYVPLLRTLGAGLRPPVSGALVTGSTGVLLLAVGVLAPLFGLGGDAALTLRLGSDAYAPILALALVSTVIAFSAFFAGVAVLGAVRTAIVSTVEPFFVSILAALVLGEPLRRSTLLGGALIAAAVVLLQLRGGRAADDTLAGATE